MKNLTMIAIGLGITVLSAFKTVKNETYKIDTQKSVIEWTGKKVLGAHNGEIKLASGAITTESKIPVKGTFVIDMNSISNKDLTDAEAKSKLLGHLRSEDFFSVDKFPAAQFAATRIRDAGNGNLNITGNLTIKGITNSISFPATYTVKGNQLTAKAANVKVDRTKYNMKFGSKSFFESIGDKAIDDEFLLNINIVAVR